MKSQLILAAFKHPRLVSDFLNFLKGSLMTFLQTNMMLFLVTGEEHNQLLNAHTLFWTQHTNTQSHVWRPHSAYKICDYISCEIQHFPWEILLLLQGKKRHELIIVLL